MLLNESYLILDNFNTLLELTEDKNISKDKIKQKFSEVLEKNSDKLDQMSAKQMSSIKAMKMKLEKANINTKKIENAIESTINKNRAMVFSAVKAKDVKALKEIAKRMILSLKNVIAPIVRNIDVKGIILKVLFAFCVYLFLHGFLHVYFYAGFSFIYNLGLDVIGEPIYNIGSYVYENSGDTIKNIVSTIIYPIYQVFIVDLLDSTTYVDFFNSISNSISIASDKLGNIITNLINSLLTIMGLTVPKDVMVAILGAFDILINPSQYVNASTIVGT